MIISLMQPQIPAQSHNIILYSQPGWKCPHRTVSMQDGIRLLVKSSGKLDIQAV